MVEIGYYLQCYCLENLAAANWMLAQTFMFSLYDYHTKTNILRDLKGISFDNVYLNDFNNIL